MKKISKNILFNIFLIFFLFGVFFYNFLQNYFLSLVFISLFLIILTILFFIYGKILKYFFVIILIFISYCFGIFISQKNLEDINLKLEEIGKYNNMRYQNFSGEILDIYKKDDFKTSYVFKILKINNKNIKNKILGIIKVPNNYKLLNGDIIKTRAKIEIIEDFSDFSYKNYMISKNIYFKSKIFSLEKIAHKKQNQILEKIEKIRKKLLDIIYLMYPKQEAIFLGGILLGARESLDSGLKQNFNNSGLTHLIAVSGFNIAILIIFFSYIFKVIPFYFRTILMIIVIILFSLLVGLSAPVLRASIMGALAYIIMSLGRKAENFSLILFTAFLMVLFSPFIINYDISFALSFLAVFGILYTQDFWKKIFSKFPEILGIKESFVLTMSAMTLTFPIMAVNFGQISIIAPITNVLVSWTIPIAMFVGFLSIIFYFFFPLLAYIIGFLAYLFLAFDIFIVNFFGSFPYSVIKIDFAELKDFINILYFLVIIFFILFFREDNKK